MIFTITMYPLLKRKSIIRLLTVFLIIITIDYNKLFFLKNISEKY